MVDNYDSFTYNLCQVGFDLQALGCGAGYGAAGYAAPRTPGDTCAASAAKRRSQRPPCCLCCVQYLGDLGCEYVVYANDEKTVEEIQAMNPAGILVSPGPGAYLPAALRTRPVAPPVLRCHPTAAPARCSAPSVPSVVRHTTHGLPVSALLCLAVVCCAGRPEDWHLS